MDINKISSYDIDMAKLYGASGVEEVEEKNSAKESSPVEITLDSESVEGFKALKEQVANSTQAGRAKYLEKIKAAIAAGEYNIDSGALADSMIEGGFLEALV